MMRMINKTFVRMRFSLIELLIVISIIAILSGLLLPALTRARGIAKSMICLGNISGISKALFNYADDYGGCLPVNQSESFSLCSSWWPYQLSIYVNGPGLDLSAIPEPGKDYEYQKVSKVKAFICPDSEGFDLGKKSYAAGYSYALNGQDYVKSSGNVLRLARILNPSNKLEALDYPGGSVFLNIRFSFDYYKIIFGMGKVISGISPGTAWKPIYKTRFYYGRHGNKIAHAYYDGHSSISGPNLLSTELWSAYYPSVTAAYDNGNIFRLQR